MEKMSPILFSVIILLAMLGGIGINYILVLGGFLRPLIAGG